MLPPLVIFSRKQLHPELTVGEVPGTMYGLSDNGWMDGEIFNNWFTHHFLVHAPASRLLLLLLDGHLTHYNPSFIRQAAQEKVVVFCLPPNTTHLTQPLDKGAFGPLKVCWNQECQRFMQQNPRRVVTQFDFMAMFSQAWYRAMTMPNIMAAFRTTGIHPFNRDSVSVVDQSTVRKFNPKSLPLSTGLAYIHLYSPSRKRSKVLTSGSGCLSRRGELVSSDVSEDSVLSEAKTATQEECDVPVFSEDEHARFRRRLKEGFHLHTDDCYNLWLSVYSPQDESARENSAFHV